MNKKTIGQKIGRKTGWFLLKVYKTNIVDSFFNRPLKEIPTKGDKFVWRKLQFTKKINKSNKQAID